MGKVLPVVYGFAIVVTVIYVLDYASGETSRLKSQAMELSNVKRELSRCVAREQAASNAGDVMDALSGQKGD